MVCHIILAECYSLSLSILCVIESDRNICYKNEFRTHGKKHINNYTIDSLYLFKNINGQGFGVDSFNQIKYACKTAKRICLSNSVHSLMKMF